MTDQEGTRGPEVRGTPIDEPTKALVPDPLVESLVPDPSQPPPPTVTLAGLLGRSAKEGHWRLYFSSALERYAEFKEEDVLGSVKIPKEQSPFAGLEATRVWLKREAEVEYTRTESWRVQAEVLQGDLTMRTPIDEPPPPQIAMLGLLRGGGFVGNIPKARGGDSSEPSPKPAGGNSSDGSPSMLSWAS
jgi:xanthosine utilization system XapX-like protein